MVYGKLCTIPVVYVYSFNTRHADTSMPRWAFRQGSYDISYLMSKEYTALIFQTIVCLGKEGRFVDEPQNLKLIKLLWQIAQIHFALSDKNFDGVYEVALDGLEVLIRSMMNGYYDMFVTFDKVQCRNIKYHYCLHLIWTLREFGSLVAVDTCFGEVKHKLVKATHK